MEIQEYSFITWMIENLRRQFDGNVKLDEAEKVNAQRWAFALFKSKRCFLKECVLISHTPRTVSISNSESISGPSVSCSVT